MTDESKQAISKSADSLTAIKAEKLKDSLQLSIEYKINANKKLMGFFDTVLIRKFNFNTFSGRAKVQYEMKGEGNDFTANFRLRKDSIIWVSISAIGGMVQAARVIITPDSFQMINYLQKEFTQISLKDIARILPIKADFYSLQNLILGLPLRNGNLKSVVDSGALWQISTEDSVFIQIISFNKTDTTMKADWLKPVKKIGYEAQLYFSEYEKLENKKIATLRSINVKKGDENLSVEIKFHNALFNSDLDFPFNIPKNYTLKIPK